ncbi:MAG: alpha/beta hydrolase [Candidatus Limivicinus sp.]
MHWIQEENYENDMAELVEPYLAARRETGFNERVIGQPIYFEHYRADEPKGVIVISHGFTESMRKFAESVYYMLQAGYDVWGVDHRGHGQSWRENENPYVVHVSRFKDFVLDLRHLVERRVLPQAKGLPLYLYCHSMGGCIGAWLIEEYPTMFRKAVLSSPMLGLSFGKTPLPIVYAAASLKGIGDRKKEPLEAVSSFEKADFENSCDSSRCRYDYYYRKRLEEPFLQTSKPSIGWGKEAVKACHRVMSRKQTERITIPVLLFQAGAETVVKTESQEQFASLVPSCRFECIPGMKHELYMTDSPVLIPYWETIFAFLEETNA